MRHEKNGSQFHREKEIEPKRAARPDASQMALAMVKKIIGGKLANRKWWLALQNERLLHKGNYGCITDSV
ncbi:MAG: hypothetical protein ABSB42_15475 [Tepidisphaeraceae bacterium]